MSDAFQRKFTFEQRLAESTRIRKLKQRHIPIIVQPHYSNTPSIPRMKYLVRKDLTVAHMAYMVRKQLKMNASDAIFLLCNGQMFSGNVELKEVEAKHVQSDGFVYLTYSNENVFG